MCRLLQQKTIMMRAPLVNDNTFAHFFFKNNKKKIILE